MYEHKSFQYVEKHQNFGKLLLRWPKVAILKWPIPLADSSELAIFRRIGHFLGESAISEYIMYIKD